MASQRIGVWFEEPAVPIDRDELALLRRAADALADAGAKVEETHPPVDFAEQGGLFVQMITPAVSVSLDDEAAEVMSGSHRQWLRGDEQRAQVRKVWADWFESYDALLCPVMPTPAITHQQEGDMFSRTIDINGASVSYLNLITWTGLIGITCLPSAVPPIGRTPAGLPVGVQVVSPYLRDRDAIALAGHLAALVGGYDVPPGF